MSESGAQTAVQSILQGIAAFANADVVINDWTVLDEPEGNAPYLIIINADNFGARKDTVEPKTTWDMPLELYEVFTGNGWEDTYNNFRTRRQAIIDEFNKAGSNRAAGGDIEVTIDLIRPDGPILAYFDRPVEDMRDATPIYIYQRFILEVEEY